jgi:hypothetical protein
VARWGHVPMLIYTPTLSPRSRGLLRASGHPPTTGAAVRCEGRRERVAAGATPQPYLEGRGAGGWPMPHYRIELITRGDETPGAAVAPDQEERRFANLGEALQRARDMYRARDASAKGFRIFNAADQLLHVWIP